MKQRLKNSVPFFCGAVFALAVGVVGYFANEAEVSRKYAAIYGTAPQEQVAAKQ